MFSGPPGNGKSSTIQALASTFDLPIYILPVASAGFSDSMLSRSMSRVASKCIIVLEDFDALQIQNSHRMPEIPVIASQPVALSGGRLSLSTILNVLDGIDSGEGRIVIASTNHLDFLQLDEALLRPGRFDLFIEFKKATKEQARELFLQFYKDYRSKVEVLEEGILPDADINTNTKFTLGVKEVKVLADEFKDMVGDEEFSVAALQGKIGII
jgi:chaperone BCS1